MSSRLRCWIPTTLLLLVLVIELGLHMNTAREATDLRRSAIHGTPRERSVALQALACRPAQADFVREQALRLLETPSLESSTLREAVFSTTLARHLPLARLELALVAIADPVERARCAFLLRFLPGNESETNQSKWIDLESFRQYWEGTPAPEAEAAPDSGVVPGAPSRRRRR